MSKEEYLARAEQAERQRQKARNREERRTYEEIARLWSRLAGREGGGPSSRTQK